MLTVERPFDSYRKNNLDQVEENFKKANSTTCTLPFCSITDGGGQLLKIFWLVKNSPYLLLALWASSFEE